MLFASAASPAIELRYDASADTNLVYHLDCLARVINCHRDGFAALWASLPANESDSAWLQRWRALRQPLRTRRFRPEPAGTSPVPFDTAIAGTGTPSSADALGEQEVLNVFRARHTAWWRDSNAADDLTRLVRGLDHSVARSRLIDRLVGLNAFFGADSNAIDVIPIALVATGNERGRTHGEYRDRSVYVETLRGEPADARAATIAHEIAHYLYAALTRDQRATIRRWFTEHDATLALPAYAVFNEAIATAFGNGIVERALVGEQRFARLFALPQSLYADRYIDIAGRVALPLLDEYLAERRAIDAQFVDRFIVALERALGTRATEQGFWLRVMVFANASPTLWPLAETIAREVRTGSLLQEDISHGCTERCLLRRYPELAGIVVTTLDTLDALRDVVPDGDVSRIRREVTIHGYVAYGVRRSDRSLLFIAAGRSAADTEVALNRLLDFGQIFVGPL
ncbi:MAG: hypothetical protein AAGC71_09870 [Pseudomonadota bacterium]